MKLYYVTLNNTDEARQIGWALLQRKLAVCVNWFPITCAYSWQGEITEEPEVVLIVKTQDGYALEIEKVIQEYITYTNFIAEISPVAVNEGFLSWLNTEVSPRAALEVTQ
ncbi:divalent-cation tolerance protein CutA [Nostoc sp. FACHB-152]|uniref:divalent-cation tolerance protein CutA n=1 Tax=unclassified Nostoc TaxID=2593658 RepID=UPI0016871545|nr:MULTISPECIES: divalent-cation tolerance protein CutA [unclassified Nostoc]MBD2450990.1 divalent-cation tolerance protein CutA [Nostoc sp. FACHB-152]MBD2471067.1 divalent-cation tolerance protein CutA [Nostoc sp. FACHB-145]